MAQNYPEEPVANNPNPDLEAAFEEVYVPGEDSDYRVEIELETDDFFYEGQLIDASDRRIWDAVDGLIEEGDEKAVGMFLSYAENGWSKQEMWRNSEYSRGEVYSITDSLEEDYGFIETGIEKVEVTSLGAEAREIMDADPEDQLHIQP